MKKMRFFIAISYKINFKFCPNFARHPNLMNGHCPKIYCPGKENPGQPMPARYQHFHARPSPTSHGQRPAKNWLDVEMGVMVGGLLFVSHIPPESQDELPNNYPEQSD